MTAEEKFNQIYQKIVDENAGYMEEERREAEEEERNKSRILVIFLMICAVIYAAYAIICQVYDEMESKDSALVVTLVIILLAIVLVAFLIIRALLISSKIGDRDGKSKIEKYDMDFKTRIIGTMIKSFEEKLDFAPQDRINGRSI